MLRWSCEDRVSISQEQRKKLGLPQTDVADNDRERTPSIERLEEGQEVSPDVAEKLQPQMGNLAVQALLTRTASSTQTSTGTGDMELAEEIGESVDEEYEGGDLSLPDLQMGGGGGDGLPGEHMPWEVGFLFGGNDEPDATPKRKRPRRRREITREHDDANTEPDDDLIDDDVDHIEETMGKTPSMREEFRAGDARYRAIELGLVSPHAIGRRALDPEAMVDRVDPLDPLGRATTICGFLSEHAAGQLARSLAETVSKPASILMLESTGHAGAAARMASLAVCTQATEGGGAAADNAVQMALNEDAWFEALNAARILAESGHVVAPEIVKKAGFTASGNGVTADVSPTKIDELSSIRLGQLALKHLLPESHIPLIPKIYIPLPKRPSHDRDVAAVDTILAELTGGQSPTDLPAENRLDAALIAPILSGATELVNQMGKTQVELAAAAIAAAKIDASVPIRGTLMHADRALRELARSVVRQGDELHRATGKPLVVLNDLPTRAVERIRASADALKALRSWSFSAIAEALHR